MNANQLAEHYAGCRKTVHIDERPAPVLSIKDSVFDDSALAQLDAPAIRQLENKYANITATLNVLSCKGDDVELRGRPAGTKFNVARMSKAHDEGQSLIQIARESGASYKYVSLLIDKYRKQMGLPARKSYTRNPTRKGMSAKIRARLPEIVPLIGLHSPTRIGFMVGIPHDTVIRAINQYKKEQENGIIKSM